MNYPFIKYSPNSFFSSKKLLIIAIFISLIQILFSNVQARNIELVLSLANECFQFHDKQVCLNAIEKAEESQLFNGFHGNYSCQTRLLGLESKLIMVILNNHKTPSYETTFNDVKAFCDQSF